MSKEYVTKDDLAGALAALKAWGSEVSTQPSRHVWSILPLKFSGAGPGLSIEYTEELDREFMERFFSLRSGDRPFFDPFSMTWLQEGYYHSNLATSRKKTFNNSWHAGSLVDGYQSLSSDYAEIFRAKALTKSGVASNIPALSCAIWFYKMPSAEWGADHEFAQGLTESDQIVRKFREDFNFVDDSEWTAIFDDNSSLDQTLKERWS